MKIFYVSFTELVLRGIYTPNTTIKPIVKGINLMIGAYFSSELLFSNAYEEVVTSQLFTSSGTFVIPNNCTRLDVTLIGGGGGSGGSAGYAHETHVSSGAGAGGFCRKTYTTQEIQSLKGTTVSFVVGAGGGVLINGGNTTFLNQIAYGGEQGYPPVGASYQRGGVGGNATGGTDNRKGLDGTTGRWVNVGGLGHGGVGWTINGQNSDKFGILYGTGGSSEYTGKPMTGVGGVAFVGYAFRKMKGV